MERKPKLLGTTFNEKVGQLNYYPPEDLLRILLQIASRRPQYENNARVRLKKEAVYNYFLNDIKLQQFFSSNISYCGLASVFFDRIFLISYPLICQAFLYENDSKMVSIVGEQIQYMVKESGLRKFLVDNGAGIEFYPTSIFNSDSHKNNKYGWIDLDSNECTSYAGCDDSFNLINKHADDRCLVSIWNAVGMKGLKFEEQRQSVKEIIIDRLKEKFELLGDDEITYDDTSLMYVRVLKLQRR